MFHYIKIMFLVTTILLSFSCNQLEYKDDLAFLSPGEANYPDYFVLINNKPCVDMTGSVGLCAYKHDESMPLNFKLLKQPYAYKLDFRCGNIQGIVFEKIIDVLKKDEVVFTISEDMLKDQRYLNCIGDIYPQDRGNNASSFFEARIRLHKDSYIKPSEVYTTTYKKGNFLVLGEHAYSAKVKTKNKWYYLNKKTYLEHDSEIQFAVVETKNMRRSYYGIKGKLKDEL